MTDPSFSVSRAEKDIQWLIQELGPRPAHSSKARLAALGIRDRLKDAGWEPKVAQLSNNIVACRGKGTYLFLAHSDSVHASPGAIDNAVGVATLLELARTTQATDLCLGFPAQEELGLVGSRHMVSILEEWHPNAEALQVVLALDLVGKGDIAVTGLSTNWGLSELNWLRTHGDITSQYGYQVVSRILPEYERSDHASFARDGFLSAQLLGSHEDGIFAEYHQPTDTSYDSMHIETLGQFLESVAVSAPPTQDPTWKSGLVLEGLIIPFWIVWPVCLGASAMGIRAFSSLREHLHNALKLLGLWICWAVLSNLPLWLSFFSPNSAEVNGSTITGISANGWWTWAGIYPFALLIFLKGLQYIPPLAASKFWTGSSTFWGALFTTGMLLIDPLLALPMAIATYLSRLHPFFLALGGIYWITGGVLRQLSFWGLLPPQLWFVLTLFLLPAIFVKK